MCLVFKYYHSFYENVEEDLFVFGLCITPQQTFNDVLFIYDVKT